MNKVAERRVWNLYMDRIVQYVEYASETGKTVITILTLQLFKPLYKFFLSTLSLAVTDDNDDENYFYEKKFSWIN